MTIIPVHRHRLVPQSIEQAWGVAKSALLGCVEEAARCDVVIGLENAPTQFLDRAAELRGMVEEIGDEHLGIAFDVAKNFLSSR